MKTLQWPFYRPEDTELTIFYTCKAVCVAYIQNMYEHCTTGTFTGTFPDDLWLRYNSHLFGHFPLSLYSTWMSVCEETSMNVKALSCAISLSP